MSSLVPAPMQKLGPLLGLLPFLRPYRRRWLATFAALTVAAAATLALPVSFRFLIDRGFAAGAHDHIDRYFVALLVLALVLAVATALRFYCVSWLGERVTADLRHAVYRHVLGMSPQFFETAQPGAILSRLTTDTTLIQTVVGSSLSLGLRNAFLLTGGLVMLLVTSRSLTAYILITLLMVVVPILLFGRRVRRLSRDSQDRVADASAMAGEVLSAMPTVQAFAQEAREVTRFAGAVETAYVTALRRIRARAWLTAVVIALVFSAICLVLWLGARAVLHGDMSAGELSQFILYAVMTAGALGAIAEVWGDLQRAAGATERLLQMLELQSPVQQTTRPVALPSAGDGVRFETVDFAYPSRPHAPALHQFSLHVRPGEHLAIVGPSGAGKTTLFALLLRFYDPQGGRITLNGIDLRDLSLHDARRLFGVVLQETVIFAGTVAENIRYGRPGASDDEVKAAARRAAADGFIEALPDGYNTWLGERGVRLSGGQRQRLAIARAILCDPQILLLDEATSALDAESERQVQQALDNLARQRTTVVIAHRLATVLAADRIVVMDAGRIVAEGRHEELLERSPLYRRVATLQFNLAPD